MTDGLKEPYLIESSLGHRYIQMYGIKHPVSYETFALASFISMEFTNRLACTDATSRQECLGCKEKDATIESLKDQLKDVMELARKGFVHWATQSIDAEEYLRKLATQDQREE